MERDKNVDPLTDFHNCLKWWKNYFCQILNVHWVNNDRQTEIRTYEPFVHKPNVFDVEIVTEKLKRYKSPGTEKILAELIQGGGDKFHSGIHKLLYTICNNEEVPQ
jgi:hypothetical protein